MLFRNDPVRTGAFERIVLKAGRNARFIIWPTCRRAKLKGIRSSAFIILAACGPSNCAATFIELLVIAAGANQSHESFSADAQNALNPVKIAIVFDAHGFIHIAFVANGEFGSHD